jgi:hypothetical protein
MGIHAIYSNGEIMFKAWPKIPRLENEVYHITEKIDGTNACVIINEQGVFAQSRTRLITPEDDNYGFAKWVQTNAKTLIQDLGEGYHYGEWWGQGINRGYGLDHKRFSLFNPTKHSDICYNVPYLGYTDAIDLQLTIEDKKDILLQHGSCASPGYYRPEGLVIYAEKAKCYWKVIIDK